MQNYLSLKAWNVFLHNVFLGIIINDYQSSIKFYQHSFHSAKFFSENFILQKQVEFYWSFAYGI